MAEELTIQEVAEATGLTQHTLRYYERAGLLDDVERNGGGHRRYRRRDVDALLFLVRLRMTGMPIQRVKEYAELVRRGESTIDARHDLLVAWRSELCRRRSELEGNLAILDYKIDLYARGWAFKGDGDPCVQELRRLCAPREKS